MLVKIKKFGGNWASSSREKKRKSFNIVNYIYYYFVILSLIFENKNESALPMDDLLTSFEIG